MNEDKITTVPGYDHAVIQTLIKFFCQANCPHPYKAQGFTEVAHEGFRVDVKVRFFPDSRSSKYQQKWIIFEVQKDMKNKLFIEKIKIMKEKGINVCVINLNELDRNIDIMADQIRVKVQDALMAYV